MARRWRNKAEAVRPSEGTRHEATWHKQVRSARIKRRRRSSRKRIRRETSFHAASKAPRSQVMHSPSIATTSKRHGGSVRSPRK